MLKYLKQEANYTLTENGAATYQTTGSDCLDLFASSGALRRENDEEIISRFLRAWTENADLAMKLLFYIRDVRGGLGERRVFRVILHWLAQNYPASVRRNLTFIPEFGRWDDPLLLLDTPCRTDAISCMHKQFQEDLSGMEQEAPISLLAKWLPSVNTSNADAVRRGKQIARAFGMTDAAYRKALSSLRAYLRILENYLRTKDYTFDYEKQPSRAMFKYRHAFLENDGPRYQEYIAKVQRGEASMHTGTLFPYEIIAPLIDAIHYCRYLPDQESAAIDATWRAQEDFTRGENALVVVDGSGSMYGGADPIPAAVALSLGIYFAERNQGAFHNHFITFSTNPRLVQIKGNTILEKVRCCHTFNEVANTNLQKVFELLLNTAVKNRLPQTELPAVLYIVSDMEFDACMDNASLTNFDFARRLFASKGYQLPKVVFWNVASRGQQVPVTANEQGVVLVSGCSPRLFSMVMDGKCSPMDFMLDILGGERYKAICA